MNRNATAVILIVLAAGIYFTFTRDLWTEVKAIQQVNKQYTDALANAEKLIRVREEVLASYNTISESDRERLSKMIPDTVDNIRLIIDLNDVALRHGFTLKNVRASANPSSANTAPTKPTPPTNPNARASIAGSQQTLPNATLDTVTVGFSVTAPYLEFISFLQDLEANLRVMDITSLSLTADDEGLYNFTVELKTYWLKQ